MPGTFDLSAADDPRPDEGADFDQAAGAEGLAPAFHPELAAEAPEAPEVDEATVRQWLDLVGLGLNYTLPGRQYGIDEAWRMTQRDLDEIAPPACRILNRHPVARAVATRADVDAFTLAAALGRYLVVNGAEVLQARRDLEAARPHLGGRDEPEGPEPAGPAWPGLTGVPNR